MADPNSEKATFDQKAQERPGLVAMAKVLLLMPVVTLGLRLLGFKRLYVGLGRVSALVARGSVSRAAVPAEAAMADARRIAETVILTNRHYSLYEVGCLVESLTLWWLLRQRGIAAEFLLGVRTILGPLESHAWVEYEGAVLNDAENVRQIFAPFDLDAMTPGV
ncbi:MAG: lasso peptide biosynthesis B2 protein [Acidobacteriota bacterium]